MKIEMKEAQGLHTEKREDEPFNGLVYMVVNRFEFIFVTNPMLHC